ncbi:MAG: 4-hydroxyphenylacetate 3-hydroxylase family protein [Acidimicrobiia bacterium]
MGARTGEEYLNGLRASKRTMWLGPDKVDDVTAHPATAGAARQMARVFDAQHTWAEDCLMPDPETGEPINVSHMIPRSKEDIQRRRRGLERISALSVGLMGRTPDYKNVTFAGFAGRWRDWAGADEQNLEGAQHLIEFQKRLRRQDLALTHTLVHPTVDKSRKDIAGDHVPLHKVGETEDSIIVSGARILATSAPFADEMLVYPGSPLPEGEVSAYALSFVIPMDTPGLTFLCRDSAASPDDDHFDRPLSTRFDEQDAFVIFDNVEIPKERVFINGMPEIYNTVMRVSWWPNIMQQTTIRALTKLEFAFGLASRIAEINGDRSEMTVDALGEILSYVELTRSGLRLAELNARDYGDGVFFPDDTPLHPLRATLTLWIPRVCEIITLMGSHNLIAAPSRAMLDEPELRPLIDTYLATADGTSAEDRAALFRLAWDFVGTTLGGRNGLYERFYLGSTGRNRKILHDVAMGAPDKRPPFYQHCQDLVQGMLARPD